MHVASAGYSTALNQFLFPAAQVAASEDPPPGPGASRCSQAWNSLPTWPLSLRG